MNSSFDALWILAHRTPEPSEKSASPRVASGLLSLLGAFEKLELPVRWWSPKCLASSPSPGLDSVLRGHLEFSNRVLWPLCHNVGTRPVRTSRNAQDYRAINQGMASSIALALADSKEKPILLLHDFHFAGVPGILRSLGVRNPIGFFWHIPFPEARELGRIPEAEFIIHSLMQTDVLGLHTRADAARFAACREAFGRGAAPRGRVHVLPAAPERPPAPAPVKVSAGGGRKIALLGIDRMDYTKGLLQKFQAIDRLLEARPQIRGGLQLVQIAAPTRGEIPEYQTYAAKVRELADRINSRWATSNALRDRVIVLLEKVLSPRQMAALHARTDIALITPLRDGMNLVAKEHVLNRFVPGSPPASLVLSHQAGAAEELCQAHLVNAADPDDIYSGLCAALDEPEDEKRQRMKALHAAISARDATHWARELVQATVQAGTADLGSGQHAPPVLTWAHEPEEESDSENRSRFRLPVHHRLRALSPPAEPLSAHRNGKTEGLSE